MADVEIVDLAPRVGALKTDLLEMQVPGAGGSGTSFKLTLDQARAAMSADMRDTMDWRVYFNSVNYIY